MKNQEANKIYEKVMESVKASLESIQQIEMQKDEDVKQIELISVELDKIASDFTEELLKLQNYSEWEKFTIAFFGETNAGKSTIIESLRIAFNEIKREELIQYNDAEYKKKKKEYASDANSLIDQLDESYMDYADRLRKIENSIEQIQIKQNKLLNPKRIIAIYSVIFVIGMVLGIVFF